MHGHDDYVGIAPGARVAEEFHIYLVELPEPAFLGSFVPEHGPYAEEFLYGIELIESVLNIGPYHGCRGLRSQGQSPSGLVFKGIHLFGDNIGFLADAPAE